MDKTHLLSLAYKNVFKPIAFQFDAEFIHDQITFVGEHMEKNNLLLEFLFSYSNPKLHKTVLGIDFANPIGLAGGFDYDGHLAEVLKYVGFGFNTVGTITAKSYAGNPGPRLVRLPKSQSLLVNKGFKSEGADSVARRLDQKNLSGHTIGISVGSTNTPEIDTIFKAIDDYLYTFSVFKNKKYVSFFELNISCPNTSLTESFKDKNNFSQLSKSITTLKLKQPIFVKMPNEASVTDSTDLIHISLKNSIRGFIFSNLVKSRNNPSLDRNELAKISRLKGNFSGKPTFENSNNLIYSARQKFGREIAIIGCGGVFTPQDAIAKFSAGADLVQLITGMIYNGPQLVGDICHHLV